MTAAIRRGCRPLSLLPLAFALLALAAGAAWGAVNYQHESLSQFEAQLKANQIHEAAINKRLRTVRLTLTDGRHALIRYAPHEEPHVRAELQARGVPVTVLGAAKKAQSKKAVHHKLRYIALGIVIAAVVIVGAVMLYNRRGRGRAAQGYG